jgi:hypothetical protein
VATFRGLEVVPTSHECSVLTCIERGSYQRYDTPEYRFCEEHWQTAVADETQQPQEAFVGPGGAPTRATTLPDGAEERKTYPVASGVLDYFPDAIAAVAHVSWRGNEQHNPGKPLHWDRSKSRDEADTMMRHFLQRGTLDKDGIRHTAKMAWRALAHLHKEN